MYMCESCGNVGDDFDEITEESISADVDAGLLDHPDDVAAALSEVGNTMCNNCGSTQVVDMS